MRMEELLIHHWDTDGVCSAALLMQNLGKKMENITPTIGNYFLTEGEINLCRNFEKVYIVDMALPESDVIKLSSFSDVTIFDHHLQKLIEGVNHINPVAKGESQEKYPSATWVLKKHFGMDVNLLVILGIVGDNEYKIKENRTFFEIVKSFCERYSTSLDQLVKAVHLIDSNYKLGDKKSVEGIPHIIGEMSIKDILEHERWNKNLETLEEEIKEALGKSRSLDKNVEMIDMESPHNIISEVTRKLAWGTGKNAVVVNRGYFPDKSQIYVRTNSLNLSSLIGELKSLGYNVGGKDRVMGAIIPKEDTDLVVEKIIKFLGGEKW